MQPDSLTHSARFNDILTIQVLIPDNNGQFAPVNNGKGHRLFHLSIQNPAIGYPLWQAGHCSNLKGIF
jgi:hypothetical protein